jgi:hypothetical protein
MRKNLSVLLKISLVICAFVGESICLFTAKFDGYSHWTRRLLYFTNQSNIWIFLATILLFLPIKEHFYHSFYVVKYIFTVAITLTGIIFCFVLAPFAEPSYHVWSASGILTHVFVPAFAIADFFVDNDKVFIEKKDIFSCLIPTLIYFALCTILFFFKVDFGRGDNFPYFFFNYLSPAGIFGFSSVFPFIIGSFYWMIFILFLILSLAFLYAKINNFLLREKSKLLDT